MRSLALLLLFALTPVPGVRAADADHGQMARAVARLDTVRSARDPLVSEVAALGDAAIPLLVAKLSSERQMSAVAASWALRQMGSDQAFAPLLERLAASSSDVEIEHVRDAMRMLLKRRISHARAPTDSTAAPLFDSLTRAVVCGGEVIPTECTLREDAGEQAALFVYGECVRPGCDLSCAGREIQVLSSGAFKQSEYLVGRYYVELALEVHDLPASAAPMPRWIAGQGAKPTAVALVQATCGRVGDDFEGRSTGTLWAMSAGEWSLAARLYEMSID